MNGWLKLTFVPVLVMTIFLAYGFGNEVYGIPYTNPKLEDNPDSLYAEARKKAQNKSYDEATEMLEQVISEYPEYWGVYIYLARVLAWQGKFETSYRRLNQVEEEARRVAWWQVYVQNAHWQDEQEKALKRIENAPDSLQTDPVLILIKARALHVLGKSSQAVRFLNQLQPHLNKQAKTLLMFLNNRISGNFAGVSLKNAYYEQNDGMILEGRAGYQAGRTQFLLRYVHARRFSLSGNMLEAEAYPVFLENFYAMVTAGFSDRILQPHWYVGVEPFIGLPGGWEVSAGGRFINYQISKTRMATASLSKYLGAWMNTLRFSYWVNEQQADKTSINIVSNYFIQGQFHKLTFRAGIGQQTHRLYDTEVSTSPFNWWASGEFIFPVYRNHHLNLKAEYAKERYTGPNTRRISFKAGYLYRF